MSATVINPLVTGRAPRERRDFPFDAPLTDQDFAIQHLPEPTPREARAVESRRIAA